MRKCGKFIHPILFKIMKSKNRFNFKSIFNLNIRKSNYFKIFTNCVFNIHNGKSFYFNDPVALSLIFKEYKNYDFNLGQFANTRQVLNRRNSSGHIIISDDLKKKKGVFIKNIKKKKKFIFKR